jgi:hypothetical protein
MAMICDGVSDLSGELEFARIGLLARRFLRRLTASTLKGGPAQDSMIDRHKDDYSKSRRYLRLTVCYVFTQGLAGTFSKT